MGNEMSVQQMKSLSSCKKSCRHKGSLPLDRHYIYDQLDCLNLSKMLDEELQRLLNLDADQLLSLKKSILSYLEKHASRDIYTASSPDMIGLAEDTICFVHSVWVPEAKITHDSWTHSLHKDYKYVNKAFLYLFALVQLARCFAEASYGPQARELTCVKFFQNIDTNTSDLRFRKSISKDLSDYYRKIFRAIAKERSTVKTELGPPANVDGHQIESISTTSGTEKLPTAVGITTQEQVQAAARQTSGLLVVESRKWTDQIKTLKDQIHQLQCDNADLVCSLAVQRAVPREDVETLTKVLTNSGELSSATINRILDNPMVQVKLDVKRKRKRNVEDIGSRDSGSK